jgi:hypothetical protein
VIPNGALRAAASRALFVIDAGSTHLLATMACAWPAWRQLDNGLSLVALLVPPIFGYAATAAVAAVWPGLFDPWRFEFPINWTLPTVQSCASMIASFVVQSHYLPIYTFGDPPIARLDLLWTDPKWLALTWAVHVAFLTAWTRLVARSRRMSQERGAR